MRASGACGWIVLGATLMWGCAQTPSVTDTSPADKAALAAPFIADGRLSAKQGSQGVAAHYDWTHEGERDELMLATPLGQTLAKLDGDPSGVEITLPDGRVARASSWDALTRAELGSPIPVQGLAAWLRGLPHSGSAHAIERDSVGRPEILRQDGWEVTYAYADAQAQRANRLTLRYAGDPSIDVRIAVDHWQ
jgi:outer membrane lipoprotein LolB